MRSFFTICFLAFSVLWLSACTSSPELQKYPRAEIDRPYTLPKGVATWTTLIPTGYFSDDSSSFFLPPIPIPIVWQSSLSDDWTLEWSPLPLSVSHQISYSKEQVLGFSTGLSLLGYDTSSGAVLNPLLSLYHRFRLGESWAVETIPSLNAQFQTKRNPWTWSAGISSGLLFQLTETFAIKPRVGLNFSRGYQAVVAEVEPERNTRLTIPLSLLTSWSFHRQWNLDAHYIYSRIGQQRGYSSHTGLFSVVHYW